jgi:acyl-homoserine lactone acylase PvdQ
VSIDRDRWGVPHVRGTTVLDLAREQGRVTAHAQLAFIHRPATPTAVTPG